MISERAFARSFNSFWNELLPLLNRNFVSIFNAAYQHSLVDSGGATPEIIPIPVTLEHPDIVAEFAFRLARLAYCDRIPLDQIELLEAIVSEAKVEALSLIQKYEGEKADNNLVISQDEQAEGIRLCKRYQLLYAAFSNDSQVEFCPKFRGAGFLDSCEGDLGISNCLVEVKTTVRKSSSKDLRQILVYLALDANAGNKRWKELGLFNPRRGTLHRINIDVLVLRLSGGRPPSDVFSDLISFAELNELIVDKQF